MKEIIVIDRASGKEFKEVTPSGGILRFLYGNPLGKLSLFLLFKRKFFSSLAGWYMNTPISKRNVRNFLKNYAIDLDEYEVPEEGFSNFNQFFYRRIKAGYRTISEGIVSPADGRIFVYQELDDHLDFFVKGRTFHLYDFLKDESLSKKYEGGSMAIVRLAPVDYHRFHFPASGGISPSQRIKGAYYSVSPLALRKSLEIFCENKREYAELKTEEYGSIIIAEVGATVVGSIYQTYDPGTHVKKGQEKGYFSMGGSTLVLFFEPGKIKFDKDLLKNTRQGKETLVKMGEQIAR